MLEIRELNSLVDYVKIMDEDVFFIVRKKFNNMVFKYGDYF